MRHLTPNILLDVTSGEARGELPLPEITAIVTDSRAVVTIAVGSCHATIAAREAGSSRATTVHLEVAETVR